jgi:hypothetical protein
VGRGPGALQQRIISELASQPTKRLPWDELKLRYPREVEQKTLHRAVRGLRRRGLVYDELGGVHPYLALTVLGDDEFLELSRVSIGLLEAAARARGVPVPPIAGLASPSRELRSDGGRQPDVGA